MGDPSTISLIPQVLLPPSAPWPALSVPAGPPPPSAFVTAAEESATSTSRVITGAAFLALWKPTEIAAMIAADPRLLAGCFKVLAQGSANLDSPETATLLALAVSRGLATDRAAQIAAGTPPA